jgi:hypothetical protein
MATATRVDFNILLMDAPQVVMFFQAACNQAPRSITNAESPQCTIIKVSL